MQQVSFPDINKNPETQTYRAALQEHTHSRRSRSPRRGGPQNNNVPDAATAGSLVPFVRWHREESELHMTKGL